MQLAQVNISLAQPAIPVYNGKIHPTYVRCHLSPDGVSLSWINKYSFLLISSSNEGSTISGSSFFAKKSFWMKKKLIPPQKRPQYVFCKKGVLGILQYSQESNCVRTTLVFSCEYYKIFLRPPLLKNICEQLLLPAKKISKWKWARSHLIPEAATRSVL